MIPDKIDSFSQSNQEKSHQAIINFTRKISTHIIFFTVPQSPSPTLTYPTLSRVVTDEATKGSFRRKKGKTFNSFLFVKWYA